MFTLETQTRLKLMHCNPRKERHGEDLVQAIDLDLRWETSNESLALFDPNLLRAMYWNAAAEKNGQVDIAGITGTVPNLRMPKIDMPVKWVLEMYGQDFRIGDEDDGLVFLGSTVKKFRLTLKEGGSVFIDFQVQCNADITPQKVGYSCELEGDDIEATLVEGEQIQDKPLATVGGEQGRVAGALTT